MSPERYPTFQNIDLVLNKQRRQKMLVQDIQQLQPHVDIFYCEEMCPETFHDFQMALGDDYAGDLVKRQFNRPLHNAMFYNKSKFRLEQYYDVNLHKGLTDLELQESLLKFKDLEFRTICNHFSFQQKADAAKKHLLVMMTHLHHDPQHDVIKYAEMSELLNNLSRIHQQLTRQGLSDNDIYVVLAGDFNAQPSNQVYHLSQGEKPTQESLK